VDAQARRCVRQNCYSVLPGWRLPGRLSTRAVEVLDGPQGLARHKRPAGVRRYLVLVHYLGVLQRKPGALLEATPLAEARAARPFNVPHQRYWDAVRRKHSDAAGTPAVIEVLLARRALPLRP
jgi:hypothetical protein